MVDPVAPTVAAGDLAQSLKAIRDRLAGELDGATHRPGCECECGTSGSDGRIVAALSKELREVLAAIDALPVVDGVSRLDQLAGKRERRRAAAGGAKAADS